MRFACSGEEFIKFFYLREAKDMGAIYYNMLHSLELVIPVGIMLIKITLSPKF